MTDGLTLVKSRTRPAKGDRVDTWNEGGKHGRLCSAVWLVRELPGIFLSADGHRGGKQVWRARYHAVTYQKDRQEISQRLAAGMAVQIFTSRSELVQALHAAWQLENSRQGKPW